MQGTNHNNRAAAENSPKKSKKPKKSNENNQINDIEEGMPTTLRTSLCIGQDENHDEENGEGRGNGEEAAGKQEDGEKEKEFERVPVESTNDFAFCYEAHWALKAVSLFISATQSMIMIYLCVENAGYYKLQGNGVLAGSLFVFMYYLAGVPSNMTKSLRAQIAVGDSEDNQFKCCLDIFPYPLRCIGAGALSIVVLIVGVLSFTFTNLCERRITPILAMFGEFLLNFSTTLAIVYIINQQTDLSNIMFNFSGVLVVLELDDVVGKLFENYKIKVPKMEKSTFDPEKPSADFGVMVVLGIVYVCVRFVTNAANHSSDDNDDGQN